MSPGAMLEQFLEPVSRCLDDDSARRLVELRVPESIQARAEYLGDRANEGGLTSEERAEYETLIGAADFLAILQLKARKQLDAR